MARKDDDKKTIIIKRVKKVEGGHHGGAWKVAYADFVTAMMAFFLLLWLLNVTTDEQKAMISAYFAPADPRIAESLSGAGGVMGGTTVATEGAMTRQQSPAVRVDDPAQGTGLEEGMEGEARGMTEKEARMTELDRQDEAAFEDAREKIQQAMENMPDLKELSQNLIIDMTPEGLRIQIVDQQGKPMFELGSAKPLPHTVTLLSMITQVVEGLPNKLSIRGHTDSKPYGADAAYTNWELSSDRANASRRVMMEKGLDVSRVHNVQGKSDREHLVQDDPESPRNRRISIILLRQSLVEGLKKDPAAPKAGRPEKPQPRKREEGVIYFP